MVAGILIPASSSRMSAGSGFWSGLSTNPGLGCSFYLIDFVKMSSLLEEITWEAHSGAVYLWFRFRFCSRVACSELGRRLL
jgi:hypothetical protein